MSQGPGAVFATAMLLGDLFPAEWPGPGRARQLGKPHPPPPGMGEASKQVPATTEPTV